MTNYPGKSGTAGADPKDNGMEVSGLLSNQSIKDEMYAL